MKAFSGKVMQHSMDKVGGNAMSGQVSVETIDATSRRIDMRFYTFPSHNNFSLFIYNSTKKKYI